MLVYPKTLPHNGGILLLLTEIGRGGYAGGNVQALR